MVENNISLAALVLKILFSPLENKIHIFAPPCNILYKCHATRSSITSSLKKCFCPENWQSSIHELAHGPFDFKCCVSLLSVSQQSYENHFNLYLILDESQSILTASNIRVTNPAYACFNVAASILVTSSSP